MSTSPRAHRAASRPSVRRARQMFAGAIEALESRQLLAATVGISAIDAIAAEPGTDTAKFRLTRSSTVGTLVVGLDVSGTATSGTDYTALPATVTFANGAATVDVTLTAKDDLEYEGPETVIVTLAESDDDAYGVDAAKAAATATINDNDKPTVSVAATEPDAAEADEQSGTFKVSRTGITTAPLTVKFTLAGTATSGADFTAIGTSVVIPAGESSVEFDVTPKDDAIPEGPETVKLTLAADAAYAITATAAQNNATVTIADDDKSTVSVVATKLTGLEGSATDLAKFTFTRNGPVTEQLYVMFELGGSATNGTDYDFIPGTWLIPAGKASVDMVIKTKQDSDYEGNETVTLQMVTSGYLLDDAKKAAAVTILEDDKPTVTLTVTDATAFESGSNTNAYFTIARTGSTALPLTVPITLGGTAKKGTDYKSISTNVVIPAGRSSQKVQIKAKDDLDVEGDETVIATLVANAAYVIGTEKTGTVNLRDDDVPTVSIAATDAKATEGKVDPGVFTITRDAVTPQPLTVKYTIAGTAKNGEDYAELTGTAVIPAGKAFTTVTVTPTNDATLEGTETVTLELDDDAAYDVSGSDDAGTVVIADDEKPTVRLESTAGFRENTVGSFSILRDGPTHDPLTVSVAMSGTAANGVDYAKLPTTFTIPAGYAYYFVTLFPVDDAIVEGDETVVATLNAGAAYLVKADAKTCTTVLADNDPATIGIVANLPNASEPAVKGQFTVTRNGLLTSPLTLYYNIGGTASYNEDYKEIPTSVTIPAGKASATIDVVPIDDEALEGRETVTLTLVTDGFLVDGAKGAATVSILDNEKPTVSLVATDGSIKEDVTEGDNTATFLFSRTGPTTDPLEVQYAVAATATAGADFEGALPGKVTIPAGESSVTVTLTGKDDGVYEGDETVTLTLKPVPLAYLSNDEKKAATVTIKDDDKPVVNIVGLVTTASEKGGKLTFNVTRDGSTAAALEVPFTIDGYAGADDFAAALPTSVVIPAGKTFSTVTIVTKDDAIYEGTEVVSAVISGGDDKPFAMGEGQWINLYVTDDELPTISIEATDDTATEAGATIGYFTLSRGVAAADELTVNIGLSGNAKNGKDYYTIGKTVTFAAGSATAQVVVKPKVDSAVEGPELVNVEVKAGSGYKVDAAKTRATVTIVDAQKPVLTVEANDDAVDENDPAGTWFRISRDGYTSNTAVTVRYQIGGTAPASSYTLTDEDGNDLGATIVIPKSEAYIDVLLSPIDNDDAGGDRTVTFSVLADESYIGTPSASITIKDDEA